MTRKEKLTDDTEFNPSAADDDTVSSSHPLKTARALFMSMTLDEAYLVTPHPSAGIYCSPQRA
ncbi:hypothetical protein E2C01_055303 [Portunus trituberculatus]|uniref:Uncharacterized protein n=1 Tax=Portunus trituberculatus TaxID=210409 RepID=A0A5B7GUG3_PORTR|nr:hypothetical protein [Portunus trituberculatus]